MVAQFIDNPDDLDEDLGKSLPSALSGYVMSKCEEWRDYKESNYVQRWEEYNRLWRGIWSEEDKTRETERSRIIAPALQQAVESAVSDIEEATFSQGQLFDLTDDFQDPNPDDVGFLRNKLTEDFQKYKIRKEVCDVLLNAAVFGTGIAEVVLDEVTEMAPASEPIMDGQLAAIGTRTKTRPVVRMRAIQPRNFLIDPTARDIDEAHGCAIDEFVPAHIVTELQERGVFRDVPVGTAPQDFNIEVDPELDTLAQDDKVRLLKYFGKVPRHLLKAYQKATEFSDDEEIEMVELFEEEEGEEEEEGPYFVEAVIVIANEGEAVLKVEENPFMMQDRPVVSFRWDVVPGSFWGRGVCEKGYNSQKALDAELRARIDALALTVHPMMSMDATRIPRGHKPTVGPGRNLLASGDPREVFHPMNFGVVDQITFAQAAELQKMLQQATGAIDGAGMQEIGSNNKTGAVSMAIGSVIKRQKRTLVNFQEGFWIPFVEKAAWRYMQFDSDNYPVKDYKFQATSSLGIMGREYEVSQLTQLLQTMPPETPMYPALVKSIVNNMNLSNREQLVKILDEASQPNQEEQQMAMEAHQKQMALQDAQINAVGGQGAESYARANKYKVEAEFYPQEMEIKQIDAVADIRTKVSTSDFERRLKIAEARMSEKKLKLEEKRINLDALGAQAERKSKERLKSKMAS